MTPDQDNHPAPSLYAEEVLCANWHPLALLLAEPRVRKQKTALDPGDAEGFLARLYPAQRA